MFNGLLINKNEQGYQVGMSSIEDSSLPERDVLVDVAYSSLNYKDALAITGQSPVVRRFPMVPGIDLVGQVKESASSDFSAGDWVVLNGWGAGEVHWGGYAQKARLDADWLVPLPTAFTPEQAMSIGTAGYTAMLCVLALEKQGVSPASGEILVTGAAGGVGSVAVAVLSKLGYQVVACSGRGSESDYLYSLGASEILPRSELSGSGKPLMKERWAGVVDVVGSQVLANACATTQYGGVVTACGLAGGMDFPATVAPFILRGVSLIGIDSVMCPKSQRLAAWQRLTTDLDITLLEKITETVALSDITQQAELMLQGQIRGRLVVNVNA